MDTASPEIVLHNSYPLTNSIVVKFARSVTIRQSLILRPLRKQDFVPTVELRSIT
jgi:hypothetical protein